MYHTGHMKKFPAALAVIASIVLFSFSGLSAQAETPERLTGQLVDSAGVLTSSQQAEVTAALDTLYEKHRFQLYVAYVSNFGDLDAKTFAEQTFTKTGMGTDDAIMVVAVDTRQYYINGLQSSRVDDAARQDIARNDTEPKLRKDEWAAAAVATAEGFSSSLSGDRGSGSSSSGGGIPLWAIGAGAVGIGAAAYGINKSRKKKAPRQIPSGQINLADLRKKAGTALVTADDSLRNAEHELQFAEIEFGHDEVKPFRVAHAEAKASLSQAFSIRQRLDDEHPETLEQQRQMLTEIVDRSESAQESLAQHAERFNQLRQISNRVPELIPKLQTTVASYHRRLSPAKETLASLSGQYSPQAITLIEDNPQNAKERLEFATHQLQAAQEAASSGDSALAYRSAEEAVAQADQLLTAVENAPERIRGAQTEVKALAADLNADLAAAAAARPAAAPAVAQQLDEATAMVQTALKMTLKVDTDPLSVLDVLTTANAKMDEALGTVREVSLNRQAALQRLAPALSSARASVGAAEDIINTNRGRIGSIARTRAAEAQHHLHQAEQSHQDPNAALILAERADSLARSAISAARNDLSNSDGHYGGGSYRNDGAGWVAGGILIDSILRGGFSGGHSSGSWGGNSGGGGGFSGGGRFGDGAGGSF